MLAPPTSRSSTADDSEGERASHRARRGSPGQAHTVPTNMPTAEFFVNYVQAWIPTFVVRLLVRYYVRLFVGWRMRCGDVVVQQILLDRKERVRAPVTTEVEVTNEQLYANDPAFFVAHLGPKLKYSACEWPVGCGADTKDPASCAKYLADAEDLTIAHKQSACMSSYGSRQ